MLKPVKLKGRIELFKFDPPIYITSSHPLGDVIIFGKGPELEASDQKMGQARIGGQFRTPNYMIAYFRAAHILIAQGQKTNTLDDICLPAFYMQRHATELLLKRLLFWIYEYAKNRKLADQPSNKKLERLEGSHDLKKLHNDLNEVCELYGFAKPPTQLASFVADLESFELSHTWSRYDSSGSEGRNGIIKHMQDEKIVPLVELQKKLEVLISTILFKFSGDEAYENDLYYAWETSSPFEKKF